MKNLEQIKEEYAKELAYESWWELSQSIPGVEACDIVVDEIAKRYATEYAKEALNNASEKAIFDTKGSVYDWEIDKQSILSEDNLPKHR